MKQLPDMIRRLPYVLYALAAVFFVWELANQWVSLSLTHQYGDAGSTVALSKSTALFYAAREAAYVVTNGALLHILIAIYDKAKGE